MTLKNAFKVFIYLFLCSILTANNPVSIPTSQYSDNGNNTVTKQRQLTTQMSYIPMENNFCPHYRNFQ